ncbi:MAG: glycosyltransferase [Candidatus Babeliales bacterium]|nr:glycosyltransferase [Candidatus Babeliales bacterium]
MKKLKIAIVTNNYKPYSGGIVNSIDVFACELKKQGHEVFIITLDFLGEDQKNEPDIYRIDCPIKFIYKKNHMAVPWRAEEAIFTALKNFGPDIIHSQHPFLLGFYALNVSKKLKIPIVFTYHTMYEDYAHYVPLPLAITKPVIKNLAISYCQSVDGIIAPSNSTLAYLQCNKITKPITVIPSGILPIYLSDFKPPDNKIFKLITVSRFVPEKNIEFLLDVYSQLDQDACKFNLIGYGSHLKYLQNYAYKVLNLSEDNVKFIVKPSKVEIADYYKSSDVFIFASKSETQGLVLAEAMAGGCPVIALNAPGACDIIQNNINGFLIESELQMIEKINYLLKDNEAHIRMQKNAWNTGQSYDQKSVTKKLITFYESIIYNII